MIINYNVRTLLFVEQKKKKKLAEQDYAKTISPPAITQKDE